MWKWLLLLGLVFVTGCWATAAIGPIAQLGIMWIEGEAHKYYNTPQTEMVGAVKTALKELDLKINNEEKKGDTVHINAGDKDRFKIKIHAVRPKTTKLSIRVNIMGDKPYAEMIYRHVDKQGGVEQFVSLKELNDSIDETPQPPPQLHRRRG